MFLSLRLAAVTSIFFISLVFGRAIPLVKRAQLCNGHAELCSRSYGNISFVGAHNSFAYSQNPFALSRNQEIDVTAQLSMGVRLLQGQAHMNGKKVHFCHNTCGLFDGGTVKRYFQKVHHFLLRHPNEVITIVLANPENVPPELWQPIFESTGLADMAYIPPQNPMTRADWPTLQQMLDSNKRVVVFMDKGAEDGTVPYLLPQFTMMWEDEYDPTDPKFPCKVDRTAGPLSPTQQLSMINQNLNVDLFPGIGHGVRFPNRFATPRTNSIYSIEAHANHCAPFAGDQYPNFVLLDFVNVGLARTAIARLNGFEY